MEHSTPLDFVLETIKNSGNPSSYVLSIFVLLYSIIDRICSMIGGPEARTIDRQFKALNDRLDKLINKLL
jgi:hypothetical protein